MYTNYMLMKIIHNRRYTNQLLIYTYIVNQYTHHHNQWPIYAHTTLLVYLFIIERQMLI